METIHVGDGDLNFDDDDYLWRYLSIEKYLSFISTLQFWFSSLSKFPDYLEGRSFYYKSDEIIWNSLINANNFSKGENDGFNKQGLFLKEKRIKTFEIVKKTHYVSCWFFSQRESQEMWDNYSNNGVALKIKAKTLHNLILNSYTDSCDNLKLLYGHCVYVPLKEFDYDILLKVIKKEIKISKALAFNKDILFSNENEFRYAICLPFDNRINYLDGTLLYSVYPIVKEIEILAHPRMTDSQIELIRRITNFCVTDIEVKRSELSI